MTDDATADALVLGAATLGESGARRMDRRVKPAWSGRPRRGPRLHRALQCRATTSPSTWR